MVSDEMILQQEPAVSQKRNMTADDEQDVVRNDEMMRILSENHSITVHTEPEFVFDFFLYHAYSKLGGFLVNILGLAVAFTGVLLYTTHRTGAMGCFLYILAAVLFLGYTPVTLKLKAEKAVKTMPEYREPIKMTFSGTEGIVTDVSGKQNHYAWDSIIKAAVTPKTIAVYTKDEEALIIPKKDFGDQFRPIYVMIAYYLGPGRMRTR